MIPLRERVVEAATRWDAAAVFRAHLISRQFITILLTWILARSSLSMEDIGTYELLHLIGYALTFFWLDAALRGYTKVFRDLPEGDRLSFSRQVAGVLTAGVLAVFLLGLGFSVLRSAPVLSGFPEPAYWALFGTFHLSFHLSSMVEVVYMQRMQPIRLATWSGLSALAQLSLLGLTVWISGSLQAGLVGLAVFGLLRLLWFIHLCEPVWPRLSASMRRWRSVSWPLALSGLIGGSAVLVDGFVIMAFFPEGSDYAVYRYGARELPFALLVASGLEWVLLDRLGGRSRPDVVQVRRYASNWLLRLMPLAVGAMLFSTPIFIWVYGDRFAGSADIFRIYTLLLISRFVLSGPLLTVLGDTRAILGIGILEALLNLVLSWWWIGIWGPQGVAWATVAAFFFDKAAQLFWLKRRHGIAVSEVVPVRPVLSYLFLLLLMYGLAPHIPALWPGEGQG